jgi:isochorismate synthase
LAGFAFRPDSNRTPAWDAWGDGALCVPKTVFWRNGDSAVACVIVDTSTENVAEQLAKHRAQISDWIDRANTIDVAADNTAVTALPDADDAQEQWENRVVSAQAAMASGKLQKVVLARSAAFRPHPHQRFDPLCTAWALRSRQIESTTFIIRRKDGQAFLGSSPEVLVELRGNRVSTVALAGTRKRDPQSGSKDDALGNALLQSPKDRAEQRLVETAIVEALRPHVREIEVPTAPVIVRHPDVQHLKTTIQGQLTAQSTIFDLLAKLHPTPAVGGLPKADALAWLNNNESLDRGWYAGPIGWINQAGEGVFVVAIRSVLMAHESASAFAGCGLIADSNPTDEWEESQIKLQTVRQGLAQHACNGRNR